ncbi:MAG: A/G-specific adenine glycosylase [Solobacterium sp.]|nr:A/G-specific adenine glycosylase [Solobacterium sp.]MCH4227797.1 A/G-specific adenine glycosylase [Solobacterium sp.]MCH4283311.1 A/G-specific adenine glycosylase [Solobacterium sp.]
MTKMKEKTAEDIVLWYTANKRSLPWRDTGNPYHVWISEIMLQQTRIEAVRPKYLSFMQELPSISALAECDEDHLMRLWEGLGYYSRARNLKKCAVLLVQEYHSQMPSDVHELEKLPGIGPYTAGAISSIAFDQAVPAVDGNVLRVLARLFAVKEDVRSDAVRKELLHTISDLYQKKQPAGFFAAFNQGLMEIGETVCMPNGIPHCHACPLQDVCRAQKEKLWDRIPYRSKLKERKIIERTLLILRDGDSFLLHKRDKTGLLAGLYEFIGIDQFMSEKEALKYTEKIGAVPLRISHLPDAKHIFTHLEWHMHAYEIQVEEIEHLKLQNCVLADKKELASLAIPSAFKTYIQWYALRD